MRRVLFFGGLALWLLSCTGGGKTNEIGPDTMVPKTDVPSASTPSPVGGTDTSKGSAPDSATNGGNNLPTTGGKYPNNSGSTQSNNQH